MILLPYFGLDYMHFHYLLNDKLNSIFLAFADNYADMILVDGISMLCNDLQVCLVCCCCCRHCYVLVYFDAIECLQHLPCVRIV